MLFRQDINKILLDRLFQNNSPYKDSIQLPTLERDSIARVLYAIYNMQPSAVKDTIMSIFGDSTFYLSLGPKQDSSHIYASYRILGMSIVSTKYIALFAKLTAGGVGAAWKAGNYTNTPDTVLNNLIRKYQIKITYKQNMGTNFILEFNNLNPVALIKALKKSTGIDSSSYRPAYDYVGSGNTIYLNFDSLGANIEYFFGCGDCPSGCSYGFTWKFAVHSFSDCSVTYNGFIYPFLYSTNPWSAYTYCGKPVITPVDFVSFSAELKENYPYLKWSVANEINIHHYEIEQSQTGKSYFMVADIVAATKGSVNKNYQWQSTKPLLQSTNYRIKAVEQSGKTFYSSILKVNHANTKDWVIIYPNPITNRILQLSINKAEASNYQMVIYSLSGKLVFQKIITTNGEQLSQTVQLPKNIASGVYSVQLVSPIGGRVLQQIVTIE
jgi:hypothetical protein